MLCITMAAAEPNAIRPIAPYTAPFLKPLTAGLVSSLENVAASTSSSKLSVSLSCSSSGLCSLRDASPNSASVSESKLVNSSGSRLPNTLLNISLIDII